MSLISVATIVAATTAAAADSSPESQASPWVEDNPPLIFEVGAYGALAAGGHFRLQNEAVTASGSSSTASLSNHPALAITVDVGPPESSQQYELFYSREDAGLRLSSTVRLADVTVEYLHLGGTVLFDDDAKIKPYAAGGLGITRFTPSEGGSTDTKFSMSLGLGLKWPVTRRFSFRLEVRGFVTAVDSNTSSFCKSGQIALTCRIHENGQAFVQGELLAGATLAF